jgi:hypothetical protein
MDMMDVFYGHGEAADYNVNESKLLTAFVFLRVLLVMFLYFLFFFGCFLCSEGWQSGCCLLHISAFF